MELLPRTEVKDPGVTVVITREPIELPFRVADKVAVQLDPGQAASADSGLKATKAPPIPSASRAP